MNGLGTAAGSAALLKLSIDLISIPNGKLLGAPSKSKIYNKAREQWVKLEQSKFKPTLSPVLY